MSLFSPLNSGISILFASSTNCSGAPTVFTVAQDSAWLRKDGRFIDPFRPQLFPNGFDSCDAVKVARLQHLKSVRRVFEECDFFIFTLGLTEILAGRGSHGAPCSSRRYRRELPAHTHFIISPSRRCAMR